MRVGAGLPTTTPRDDPAVLLDWARDAEAGPFTSLGVVDRVVYDSHDPLTTLAAAAAVTERVRLVTMIAIAPIRNATILAKQAASIDALSGGRLVLGLSLGAREDDYLATGAAWRDRGRSFDRQLARIREVWEDPAIGPHGGTQDGPPLLVGGGSAPAFLRAARFADGYVHGGGPPRAFESAASHARSAWVDAGRPGEPQLWGQSYFTLTDPDAGDAYLRDYYAFTGAFAERIAADLLTSPEAVQDRVRGYRDAGCRELVLLPATSDPSELSRLAEAVAPVVDG